jgi:mRNA interferase RelE/StbE
MYKLIARKNVKKFIEKRIYKEQENIKNKLKILKENPYPSNKKLDIKKLKNTPFYRLRVNQYRFIYEVIENEVVILLLEADNRGDIY